MKKGKGKPFPKGVSGNPGGRPKLPDDIKEARKMNQHDLERMLNRYFDMDSDELKACIQDPKTKSFEKLIATILWKGIQSGDYARCNFLLDRAVGKVTESVKLDLPVPTIIQLPNNQSLVLGAKPGTKRE